MDILGKITFFIIALIVIGILVSFPVMWLWNWLMPPIFGLITIDVFQAFGLFLLGGFLFKGTS